MTYSTNVLPAARLIALLYCRKKKKSALICLFYHVSYLEFQIVVVICEYTQVSFEAQRHTK